MRFTSLVVVSALAALATFSPSTSIAMAAVSTDDEVYKTKIAHKLLHAIEKDATLEADIMVQLESPEEVMQRVCGQDGDEPLTRAQKTTCMVDNMQHFADESQADVKALLAQHEGEYADKIFFWINNSVAVKKAKGSLVLELAKLDTVLKIRPEQIFHTMHGSHATPKPTEKTEDVSASTPFSLGVIH